MKFVPTYTTHLERYIFALEHSYKQRVLDVGCKDGDGSILLSYGATELDLADFNEKYLDTAKKNDYKCPTKFHLVDLEKDFPEGKWDTIVAFEILEHLEDPEFLVKNIKKHLRFGGSFVFSVPNMVANREHKVLFDKKKIQDLISKYFTITEFYEQKDKVLSGKPNYKGLLCYVGVAMNTDLDFDPKNIYGENYYKDFNNLEDKEACKNFIRIFKIRKLRPKSVLDIGCGRGKFVKLLREKGIEAWGTDFSDFAGTLIPDWFIKHDATQPFPFKDKQFDLVMSSGFFEHLEEKDIDKVYNEMKRVGNKIVALIGYKSKKVGDFESHLTIRDRAWWQNKLPEVDII